MKPELLSLIPSGKGFCIKSNLILKAFHAILLGLFFTTVSTNTYAQTAQWVLDATVSDVKVYHMITKCGDMDVVYLKFINDNSEAKKISWDATYVTNKPTPVVNPQGRQVLNLSTGEIAGVNCNAETNRALYLLAYEIGEGNQPTISGFSISNITVE